LVSGFVIDGTAARTLLIRGIGPGLHDVFGVNGQLSIHCWKSTKPSTAWTHDCIQ